MASSGFIGPLPNEEQLIEAARKDFKQFEPLYDHYYDQIFRFIYRRMDDSDVAADLVSQTFMKALGNLKRYQYRGVPFGAWLYKIASNEVKKYYRTKGARQVFSLEQERVADLIEWEPDEDRDDRINELVKFLEDLEERELAVIEMRFFEEKGFKEIAYILDMKESAVKMRTYRALEKLKEFFKLKVND